MANVGFKLGTQAKANQMMASPSEHPVETGSFYLTSDTHRLYIGALPTSTDKDSGEVTFTSQTAQLYPLNEGIITVKNLNSLPIFNPGTPEELAAIGSFYYVESGNILCIYGGTSSGNGWIQVNTNTDTNVNGVSYALTQDGNNKTIITFSLKDDEGKAFQDFFSIETKGSIVQRVETTEGGALTKNIILEGDTYDLGLEPNAQDQTGNKIFDITLKSKNTESTSSTISVEAGTGISFTKVDSEANPKLKISADDSNKIAGVAVKQGYIASSADLEGFRVELTTEDGRTIVSDATAQDSFLNPIIQIGKDDIEYVNFKKGMAVLDAYTATEIQKMLKELNAMHYLGTIGLNGSVAQKITHDGHGLHIMTGDETELQVKIGDMLIVSQSIDNPLVTGANYATGTMLICNSKTGKEGNGDYIDPEDLVLEAIESTLDSDTTYTMARVKDEVDKYGIRLLSKDSGEYGRFLLTTEKGLGDASNPSPGPILLSCEESGTAERPQTVVTVNHSKMVSQLVNDTENVVSQNSGKSFDIPVVVGYDTDGYGHISAVRLQTYRVIDTVAKIKSILNKTYAYQSEKTNVGSIEITATTTTDMGADTSVQGYVNIISDTLSIGVDNTKSHILNGSTHQAGLSINMVWGEF